MTEDIKFEMLDACDIEAVGPLWKALMDHVAALPDGLVPVRPSEESWVLERAVMLEALEGDAFVLVARRDGEAVGYAFVTVDGPDPVWYTGVERAELAHLVVAEGERGSGVGSALLDAVDAELERRGVEDVEIGVDTGNDGAARLYESRGYRADFRIFYGSPGRKPWACLRREAEDREAGRGRFAPPGPAATEAGSPTEARTTSRKAVAASSEPVIERVSRESLEELEPLWAELLSHHAGVWSIVPARIRADSWPRRRAQYETWLAADGSFALAARREDALIGYILVAVDEADETYATGERVARIETMLVAESERENGVGGLLLDAAMAELGTQGIDDIFVAYMHGNDGARRFYERLRFSPFVHLLYARRPGAQPVPRLDPEER